MSNDCNPIPCTCKDGKTGLQGLPGPAGSNGVNGTTGLQGPFGLQGLQGEQGEQGISGLQGIPGLPGTGTNIGPQGPQGPQGDQGIQGIDGIQINGIDGIPGNDAPDWETPRLFDQTCSIIDPQAVPGLPGTSCKIVYYWDIPPTVYTPIAINETTNDYYWRLPGWTTYGGILPPVGTTLQIVGTNISNSPTRIEIMLNQTFEISGDVGGNVSQVGFNNPPTAVGPVDANSPIVEVPLGGSITCMFVGTFLNQRWIIVSKIIPGGGDPLFL